MSENDTGSPAATGGGDETAEGIPNDPEELAAQIDLLAEENRRLRTEYRRVRQTRYRNTASGMAALGLVALAGSALLPDSRVVLLALSGTGLFAAVLLYTLTPERFVAASVGERVVETHAALGEALVADLGLSDTRIYLPGGGDARLFVPQHQTTTPPDVDAISGIFVVDEEYRGIAVPASGAGMYREFERNLTGDIAADPGPLAEQLTDALVDGFELAETARPEVEAGRLTVGVEGVAYGDSEAFDHPVPSFLGVGVASALDVPGTVEVEPGDDRADKLITVRWTADAA